MGAKDVTIEIEVRGQDIICEPTVTVFKHKKVEWVAVGGFDFELEFARSRPPDKWPFDGAAPPGNKTPRGKSFSDKIAADDGDEFKYSVIVPGVGVLDPMIIVGR